MNRMDFCTHRVLVVGGKTYSVQLLRAALAVAGIGNIVHVGEGHRALALLGRVRFNAVFCDHHATSPGNKSFIVAARHDKSALNPMIPIFLLKERASRHDVEAARDSGATDVLTIPISAKTLINKLESAIRAPRPFIVASDFFGPDRRSKARMTYDDSDRRKLVPKKTKVIVHI